MAYTSGVVATTHVEMAPLSDHKIVKSNGDSSSVLSHITPDPLTPGRLRLAMAVMATGEGKVLDTIGWLFTPIYLEGNSASSAYWGGLEELLGNIRDFMEEVRLTQWPMPFFRQATQQSYLMNIEALLKWTQEYIEELKRLQVWRLRHLHSSSKALRQPLKPSDPFDPFNKLSA